MFVNDLPINPIPKLSDKLVGTRVGDTPENATYNFTIEEILSLFGSEILGFQRIDDSEYRDDTYLAVQDGNTKTLTNNGQFFSLIIGSNTFFDSEGKIFPLKENDVYQLSIVFDASSSNTNNGHIDLFLEGPQDYDRIKKTLTFAKGNDVMQNFYESFTFYADADFIENGAALMISSTGSDVKIQNIIFFINRISIG